MDSKVKISDNVRKIKDNLFTSDITFDLEDTLINLGFSEDEVEDNLKVEAFKEINERSNATMALCFLKNIPSLVYHYLDDERSGDEGAKYKSFLIFEKFGYLVQELILMTLNVPEAAFMIRKALEAGVDYWVVKMIANEFKHGDVGKVREVLQGAINGLNYTSLKKILDKSSAKTALKERKKLEEDPENFKTYNTDYILSVYKSSGKPEFNKEVYMTEYDKNDLSFLFGGMYDLAGTGVTLEDLNNFLKPELLDYSRDSSIAMSIHFLLENNISLDSEDAKFFVNPHYTSRYNNNVLDVYSDGFDKEFIDKLRNQDTDVEFFYTVPYIYEKYPDKYQDMYHHSLNRDIVSELKDHPDESTFNAIKKIKNMEAKVSSNYSYNRYVGKYFNGENKKTNNLLDEKEIVAILDSLLKFYHDKDNYYDRFGEFYEEFRHLFNVDQLSVFYLFNEVHDVDLEVIKADKDFLELWKYFFNPNLCAEQLILIYGTVLEGFFMRKKKIIPMAKYLSQPQWSRLDFEEIYYYLNNFRKFINLGYKFPKIRFGFSGLSTYDIDNNNIDKMKLLFDPFYNEYSNDEKIMPLADNRYGAPKDDYVRLFDPIRDGFDQEKKERVNDTHEEVQAENTFEKNIQQSKTEQQNKFNNQNLNTIKNLFDNGVSRETLIASGFSESEVDAVTSFNNDILINLIKNGVNEAILEQSGYSKEDIKLAKIILNK